MTQQLTPEIIEQISKRIPDGRPSGKLQFQPVGGGCINSCFRVQDGERSFFCKISSPGAFPGMFATEARGLELLGQSGTVRTPEVYAVQDAPAGLLLMEWIAPGERNRNFWQEFGKQLAALHAITSSTAGLESDNYIGSLVQYNKPMKDWPEFFRRNRLEPLIRLCREKNLLQTRHVAAFERLYPILGDYFDSPAHSLLHGDLWSGNFICNRESMPVLVDPAVYYGHYGMDLAMTTLFGGFHPAFYESYQYHHPLPPDHRSTWEICSLYPLLVHLLLFGESYLPSIESILKQFTGE